MFIWIMFVYPYTITKQDPAHPFWLVKANRNEVALKSEGQRERWGKSVLTGPRRGLLLHNGLFCFLWAFCFCGCGRSRLPSRCCLLLFVVGGRSPLCVYWRAAAPCWCLVDAPHIGGKTIFSYNKTTFSPTLIVYIISQNLNSVNRIWHLFQTFM